MRRGSPVGSARGHAVRQGMVRETDARSATDLGLAAGFQVSLLPLGVLVECLTERGGLVAADFLRDAGRDGAIPERFLDIWVLRARGWLRLAQGRIAEAIADFSDLGARGEHGWRPWNPGISPYRSGWRSHCCAPATPSGSARWPSPSWTCRAGGWWRPGRWGCRCARWGQVTGDTELLRENVDVLGGSGSALEHALTRGTRLGDPPRRPPRRHPRGPGRRTGAQPPRGARSWAPPGRWRGNQASSPSWRSRPSRIAELRGFLFDLHAFDEFFSEESGSARRARRRPARRARTGTTRG